jgi:hypothetical protein
MKESIGIISSRPRARPPVEYFATSKDEYIASISAYARQFKEQNGRNPTRTEIEGAISVGEILAVPTNIFTHVRNLLDLLGIESVNKGGHEESFSDEELVEAVAKAFGEKCNQEAERVGKPVSESKKKKLKLTMENYKALRKSGALGNAPSEQTLVRRFGREFGPSWDDVLEKAALYTGKKKPDTKRFLK